MEFHLWFIKEFHLEFLEKFFRGLLKEFQLLRIPPFEDSIFSYSSRSSFCDSSSSFFWNLCISSFLEFLQEFLLWFVPSFIQNLLSGFLQEFHSTFLQEFFWIFSRNSLWDSTRIFFLDSFSGTPSLIRMGVFPMFYAGAHPGNPPGILVGRPSWISQGIRYAIPAYSSWIPLIDLLHEFHMELFYEFIIKFLLIKESTSFLSLGELSVVSWTSWNSNAWWGFPE